MSASSERYLAEQEAEERLRDHAEDLLEALKFAAGVIEEYSKNPRLLDIERADCTFSLRIIDESIRRAEGKQP